MTKISAKFYAKRLKPLETHRRDLMQKTLNHTPWTEGETKLLNEMISAIMTHESVALASAAHEAKEKKQKEKMIRKQQKQADNAK